MASLPFGSFVTRMLECSRVFIEILYQHIERSEFLEGFWTSKPASSSRPSHHQRSWVMAMYRDLVENLPFLSRSQHLSLPATKVTWQAHHLHQSAPLQSLHLVYWPLKIFRKKNIDLLKSIVTLPTAQTSCTEMLGSLQYLNYWANSTLRAESATTHLPWN